MKIFQLKSVAILFVLSIILFNTCTFAQQDDEQKPPPPPGQENEHFGPPHMMIPPMQQAGHFPEIPDLTEEQKEKIKELEINFMKEALPIKNQIGEREAHLRTLSTDEEADMNAINSIIEEIGELNILLMKKQAAKHQEIRKILNEDQRIIFDLGPQHHEKHPKKN